MELYQLNRNSNHETFLIKKFNEDLELQSEWEMRIGLRGALHCNCWRGMKGWCRHKEMFGEFFQEGHISDGWFLVRETHEWRKPLG